MKLKKIIKEGKKKKTIEKEKNTENKNKESKKINEKNSKKNEENKKDKKTKSNKKSKNKKILLTTILLILVLIITIYFYNNYYVVYKDKNFLKAKSFIEEKKVKNVIFLGEKKYKKFKVNYSNYNITILPEIISKNKVEYIILNYNSTNNNSIFKTKRYLEKHNYSLPLYNETYGDYYFKKVLEEKGKNNFVIFEVKKVNVFG